MNTLRCDVVLVAANARSLVANRGDLIQCMLDKGLRVCALVPKADYLPEVEKLGIQIIQISISRAAIDPIGDLRATIQMARQLRSLAPRIALSYGLKPVVYGTIACWLARVPRRFGMVTGMGHIYTTTNRRTRLLRPVVDRLYSVAFALCERVFVQNEDDAALLQERVSRSRTKLVLISGSGVNLERFPFSPVDTRKSLTFLFVGRLLTEKGLREFVEAARLARLRFPEAALRFVAVGPHQPSLPHAVPKGDIDQWKAEGVVEFVGRVDDVREWIAKSTVMVLPSYREGTPRAVLEAMSMGRPIITTDAPGCRETISESERNGILVPVGDVGALASAFEKFIIDPTIVGEMGKNSRRFAEAKFDVNKVNKTILEALELA